MMLQHAAGRSRSRINLGRTASRMARLSGGRLARAGLIRALGLVLLAGGAPAAHAQACRTTSLIPTLDALPVRNAATGQIVALQRSNLNYRPTVHIWMNNAYVGQYYVPVQIYPNQLDVLLHTEIRLEPWMGQMRQVQKVVPYLRACGSWFW
jgi:hypothetical protein